MALNNFMANLGLENLLALLAVVVIGLPHGAFDGAIANQLGFRKQPYFLMRFLLLYIMMAVAVVFFWLAFPTVSLILFLLISTLHFGFGDARAKGGWFRWVQVIAHGAVVVVGISQFHKLEVDKIFSFLSGHETSLVWIVMDMLSIVFVPIFVIYTWQALLDKRWRPAFIELIILLIAFAFFPPLVGFALYFCCIHSTRHFLVLLRSLQIALRRNDFYVQAFIFTVVSWAVGCVVYWWCIDQMSGETALLRVVFVGLAALTVPHMILVDGFFRRHSESLRKLNKKDKI